MVLENSLIASPGPDPGFNHSYCKMLWRNAKKCGISDSELFGYKPNSFLENFQSSYKNILPVWLWGFFFFNLRQKC